MNFQSLNKSLSLKNYDKSTRVDTISDLSIYRNKLEISSQTAWQMYVYIMLKVNFLIISHWHIAIYILKINL